jgi:hypothetical protein
MTGSAPRRLRLRRARSIAALVPLVGLFLLMPPFIRVFAGGATVFGAPLILAYLLAVWVGLIVAAARLARGFGGRPPPSRTWR